MNSPNDNFSDNIEQRLAQLTVVGPSDDFENLGRGLGNATARRVGWRLPAVFTTAFAVIVALSIQLNIDREGSRSSDTDQPSYNVAALDESSGAGPVSAPVSAFVAGRHYTEINSPISDATQPSSAIRVFFYYPCFPCYEFEEILNDWREASAEGIPLSYVPVTWSEETRYYAQLFYTAENLGVQAQFHERLFDALHLEVQPREDQLLIAHLFESLGITQQQFLSAFNSEEVLNRVREAERLNSEFSIQTVPTLIVECRYRITPNSEVGQREMIDVAQYLLDGSQAQEIRAC